MSSFLQEIITDENLVWGKSLENNPEKFFVKLTSKTINELKTKKILQGVGLLIIDGKSFLDFSKDEITKIYEMVCNILGT